MQIVLGDKKAQKVNDAIEYILNADNRTFNRIMRALRNPNGELDIRYRAEIDDPSKTQEVTKTADVVRAIRELDTKGLSEIQLKRVERVSKSRGEKDLRRFIQGKYGISTREAKELLAVLTGEKSFNEFIAEKKNSEPARRSLFSLFRRNKEKALPEGNMSVEGKYSQLISKIVHEDISFSFPIEHLDNANYAKVQTIMFGERASREYSLVLGRDVEPDWKINPELREYVYQDMPKDLSPEEQAVWIYMKLCKTFSYDDRQVFDTKDYSLNRAFLEGVKPGDKLICFDFSRIYARFINEDLGDKLEAKIIGGTGHFLVELIGEDSVATVEATTARGHSNEFYKMRMGLPIEGIRAVYDPNARFGKAIEKITPLIYGNEVQSINSYMNMLDTIRAQEEMSRGESEKIDVGGKLSALAETMKERGIDGTEAMMGVMAFGAAGFFGQDTQRTWIKQNVQDEVIGQEGRSTIVISDPFGEEFFVLNGDTMEVETLQREEIIDRFNSGKYEYRSRKHTMAVLEGEVPIPEEEEEKEGEKEDDVK